MMVKQWRYFLLAVGFFTRIPIPPLPDFDPDELHHTSPYFPVVGCIVGVIGAMGYWMASLFFPISVAVMLSIVLTILVTGAFHEDGLADSADGLGGGWSKEQILTIMQDSRLGTYGALALMGALWLKYQVLTALSPEHIPLVIVCGHTVSRLAIVWMMVRLTYAKPEGKAKPLATRVTLWQLVFANLFTGLILIGGSSIMTEDAFSQPTPWAIFLFSLVPLLMVWVWWRSVLQRNLQGYTGDTLGATQQLSEIAFYLGVLLWSSR